MVAWLKANYPGVRILALNPPLIRELIGADYNVKLNGPETLLAVIATALGGASATLAAKLPPKTEGAGDTAVGRRN